MTTDVDAEMRAALNRVIARLADIVRNHIATDDVCGVAFCSGIGRAIGELHYERDIVLRRDRLAEQAERARCEAADAAHARVEAGLAELRDADAITTSPHERFDTSEEP